MNIEILDSFVEKFNKLSSEKEFINRIKSTIFLYIDTRKNLKNSITEFNKEITNLNLENQNQSKESDQNQSKESDQNQSKESDQNQSKESDQKKIKNHCINNLYKKISLKCHPDKTKNDTYIQIFKEFNKLYKDSSIAQFIGLFLIYEDILPNIKHNINFEDTDLKTLIIKDISEFIAEINYMQNTNAWKWYYGDELTKIEIINDIKTQFNINNVIVDNNNDDNVIVDNNNNDIVIDDNNDIVNDDINNDIVNDDINNDDINNDDDELSNIIIKNNMILLNNL